MVASSNFENAEHEPVTSYAFVQYPEIRRQSRKPICLDLSESFSCFFLYMHFMQLILYICCKVERRFENEVVIYFNISYVKLMSRVFRREQREIGDDDNVVGDSEQSGSNNHDGDGQTRLRSYTKSFHSVVDVRPYRLGCCGFFTKSLSLSCSRPLARQKKTISSPCCSRKSIYRTRTQTE